MSQIKEAEEEPEGTKAMKMKNAKVESYGKIYN